MVPVTNARALFRYGIWKQRNHTTETTYDRYPVTDEAQMQTAMEWLRMKEYNNYYFKDRPDGVQLMSGLPLPKDPDGVVRHVTFINCDFHPNCKDVRFEDCLFKDCDNPSIDIDIPPPATR